MAVPDRPRSYGVMIVHGFLGLIVGIVIGFVLSIPLPAGWSLPVMVGLAIVCAVTAAIQGDRFFDFAKFR